MAVVEHVCHVGGRQYTCICSTGVEHYADEMDLSPEEIRVLRASSVVSTPSPSAD